MTGLDLFKVHLEEQVPAAVGSLPCTWAADEITRQLSQLFGSVHGRSSVHGIVRVVNSQVSNPLGMPVVLHFHSARSQIRTSLKFRVSVTLN